MKAFVVRAGEWEVQKSKTRDGQPYTCFSEVRNKTCPKGTEIITQK